VEPVWPEDAIDMRPHCRTILAWLPLLSRIDQLCFIRYIVFHTGRNEDQICPPYLTLKPCAPSRGTDTTRVRKGIGMGRGFGKGVHVTAALPRW
jgi:hypothetical protein